MKRLCILIIALAALIYPITAHAAPAACSGLDDYQAALITAVPYDDLEWLLGFLEDDAATARPSQLARASAIFDDWATDVDAMPMGDVPRAARAYHAAFIDYLGVSSAVLNALATSGPLGALAYTDAMDQAGAELDQTNAAGADRCGAEWPFSDDTASSEV